MNIELFGVYWSAILVGGLMASALSLLGAHLAARDKALQTLTISQAATTGVLFGVVMSGAEANGALNSALPPLFALISAGLIFIFNEMLLTKKRSGRSNILIAVFATLLALSYGVIAFFPQLEGHMAQAFFGDLVTLAGVELWVSAVAAVLGILVLLLQGRQYLDASFALAIFGPVEQLPKREQIPFNLLALLLVSISVYGLGLLFTVAALFIPTVILSYQNGGSIRGHLWAISLCACIATMLGFSASLFFTRMPTVPAIVLCILVVSFLPLTVSKLRS